MTKYVIVTGGVLSGLGKGVLIASIGNLIAKNKKSVIIKCDGYLNINPGFLNSVEHGEIFVLDDGTECDMDFGHYERFIGVNAKGNWSLTMGKIFQSIIEKEKQGFFLGKTIQFIPHVTNEIKEKIFDIVSSESVGEEKVELVFIEVGGTIGDLENSFYLEAIKQLVWELGKENMFFVHLSYVPIPFGTNEQKSKPTQMSVKLLNEIGIQPDVIVCRCSEYLTENVKKKISLFCNVPEENVLTGIDVNSVYLLPSVLRKQSLGKIISKKLGISINGDNNNFDELAKKMVNGFEKTLVIGLCGENSEIVDSFASIIEALKHCSANLETRVETKIINTNDLENKFQLNDLKKFDGIIFSGDFVETSFNDEQNKCFKNNFDKNYLVNEKKIMRFVRENNIPFLGVGFGFQIVINELIDACFKDNKNFKNNDELFSFNQNSFNKQNNSYLGLKQIDLKKNSILNKVYKKSVIHERYRYKIELSFDELNKLLQNCQNKNCLNNNLVFSGLVQNNIECVELTQNNFFVAVQFRPELKSRLEEPAPLFFGFLKKILVLKK